MRFAGCSPKHRSVYSFMYCCMIWLAILVTLVLQGVYLATTHYEDLGAAMIDIIMFAGFWQLFAKMYTIFTKNELLSNIIDTINSTFWTHDNLNETQRNEIQVIYNITQLSVRLYKIIGILNVLGLFVIAYVRGYEGSVVNVWFPRIIRQHIQVWPYHEMFFFIQVFFMIVPCLTVYREIDTMFIITFAASLAQLKMLKFKLKSLRRCNLKEKKFILVECCKHHVMVLGFFGKMEEIFSSNKLNIFGTGGFINVLALYSCMTEQNIIRITEYMFMIISISFQLYVFCFIGQIIQDENLSIADAAYECHWEETPDQIVRKTLLMMILRSQRYVNITVGGFAVLSLETFTKIAQSLMSFLTFMLSFIEQ